MNRSIQPLPAAKWVLGQSLYAGYHFAADFSPTEGQIGSSGSSRSPLHRCQPLKSSYFNTNAPTHKYRKHTFKENLGYCRTGANLSGSIYCLPPSLCQAMQSMLHRTLGKGCVRIRYRSEIRLLPNQCLSQVSLIKVNRFFYLIRFIISFIESYFN